MPLTKDQYDFVNYVDKQYFLLGSPPGKSVASRQFGVSEARIETLYNSPAVAEALAERGISITRAGEGAFSAEQLAYVNAVLDPADTRTRKKLLADLGLKSQTVQAWNADPAFQSYLRDRANKMFPNIETEARIAHMDNVMRGDMNAVKLAYEMTGVWSSKTVAELNVDFLMQKIIEILVINLSHDPVALAKIGEQLGALSQGNSISSTAVAGSGPPSLKVLEYDPAE